MDYSASDYTNRGYRHPFIIGTHFLGGVGDDPRTLVELAMSKFSAELRRQKAWWSRYKDLSVREAWAMEALERDWVIQTPSGQADVTLSRRQVDYVLDELDGYASLRDEDMGCQVSCFERIWESDSILDPAVLARLNSSFRGQSSPRDAFHTSIIDSFSYPLVYNKSLLRYAHRPPFTISPPPLADIYTLSQRFSFLPTDLFVSSSGSVELLSYINNVNPDDTTFYKLLATTLSSFIPLFERTLTDLHRNNPLGQRIPGACRYKVWDEPDPPDHSDDEEGWATYERSMRHWVMNRPIELPDIPLSGYPGGLEHRKHQVTLRNKRLQVIIDVSGIRLTPENPSYVGFPWHVEGMRNERIAACGLYFTSLDNIQDSNIQFRMAVTYPRGFKEGDSGATLRTWGLHDGDSCHQHIGSVPLRSGLGLVFPNIYQHRLAPFSLANSTREGHLTVVKFLLVDPDVQPVYSTAVVPPQQTEWIEDAVYESLDERLPVELIEHVMEYVREGLMSQEEAERYRGEMLAERERFWRASDSYHFCIPFDVWNGPVLLP